MRAFQEYVDLLFSLLGGSLDVAVSALDKYLWIVARAFRLSTGILICAICFIALSELLGIAALLSLAIVLVGIVVAIWSVLVFPLVTLVELGSQWAPVRRQLQTLGFIALCCVALAFLAIRLPHGVAGFSIVLSVFVLLMGLMAFGVKPTRKTLGLQLILTALFTMFATVFPQTSGLIGVTAGAVDRQVSRQLTRRPVELEMTVDVLTGRLGDGPAVFSSIDGSPNWWCRVDELETSKYRCFDQPGRDESTGTELFPITATIIQEALKNIKSAEMEARQEAEINEANRIAEEAERAKLERERRLAQEAARIAREAEASRRTQARLELEAAQKAEEEKRIEREYQNKYLLPLTFADSVIGAIHAEDSAKRANITKTLQNNIDGFRIFLRERAFADGVFDRLIKGDANELMRLGLSSAAPKVILGQLVEEVESITGLESGRRAKATLSMVVLDTGNYFQLENFVLFAEALGQSDEIATRRAMDDLEGQLLELIKEKDLGRI